VFNVSPVRVPLGFGEAIEGTSIEGTEKHRRVVDAAYFSGVVTGALVFEGAVFSFSARRGSGS
jgi:hypothetical protein